jgi:hypothetical protein
MFEGRIDLDGTTHSVAVLAAEVLRLRWPTKWVARCFRSFSEGDPRPYAHFVRMFGKHLQECIMLAAATENDAHGYSGRFVYESCAAAAHRALAEVQHSQTGRQYLYDRK